MTVAVAASSPLPPDWNADAKRIRAIHLARGSIPKVEFLRLADKYGRSPETIRGWYNGRPRGPRLPFELTDEMLVVVCRLEDVKAAWRELSEDGSVSIGYHAFFHAWKRVDPAIRTGLLKGIREVRTKQIFGRYPTFGRNSEWQVDSTMANNYVLPVRGTKPFRPWHEFAVDAHCRFMWMAVVDAHPDSETQSALIADAILGRTAPDGTFIGVIPGRCRMDRGRDYLGRVVADVLGRVDVPVFPCAARSPWEKGKVEGGPETIMHRLGPTTPGYVHEYEIGQRDPWHPADGRLLTFEEYVTRAFEVLHWYNFERPHEALAWRTPFEAWRDETNAIIRLGSEREGDLAYLFLRKAVTRRVSKDGIHFRNRDYSDALLHPYVGERLVLGYSEHDPSFIHAFRGEHWVGRIELLRDLTPEEGKQIKRERRKQVATVRSLQRRAVVQRSSVAPADRGSASKVTREKATPAPAPNRRGIGVVQKRSAVRAEKRKETPA